MTADPRELFASCAVPTFVPPAPRGLRHYMSFPRPMGVGGLAGTTGHSMSLLKMTDIRCPTFTPFLKPRRPPPSSQFLV